MTVVLVGPIRVTLGGLVASVPVVRGGNEAVVTTGRVTMIGCVNEVGEQLHLHPGFKVLLDLVDNRNLIAVVVVVVDDDATGANAVDVVAAIVVVGGSGHPQFLHGLQRESLGAVGTYFLQFS